MHLSSEGLMPPGSWRYRGLVSPHDDQMIGFDLPIVTDASDGVLLDIVTPSGEFCRIPMVGDAVTGTTQAPTVGALIVTPKWRGRLRDGCYEET